MGITLSCLSGSVPCRISVMLLGIYQESFLRFHIKIKNYTTLALYALYLTWKLVYFLLFIIHYRSTQGIHKSLFVLHIRGTWTGITRNHLFAGKPLQGAVNSPQTSLGMVNTLHRVWGKWTHCSLRVTHNSTPILFPQPPQFVNLFTWPKERQREPNRTEPTR